MISADTTPISVRGFSFRYPGADKYVLRDVDLTVEAGEFTAVIGGNGCGKTTLCKTFNGLVPHFYEGSVEGTVSVFGTDTAEASVSELSRNVGYVFQEFENQLVQPTVLEDVEFAPLNHGHVDYRDRARTALDRLGIGRLADRFVWELSGGQQHLAALAGALSVDPEVVVVDEPAAQLDPMNAELAYEHLRRLHEDHEKTIVVIEHHTEFVADYCTHVVLVDDGRIVWKKPTAEAMNQLDDLRARNIYPPQVTQVAERVPEATVDGDRLPVTVEEAVGAFGVVHPSADGGLRSDVTADAVGSACLGTTADGSETVATLDGVTHGYRTLRNGRTTVFDDLSLSFRAGERIAVLGGNGTGKSTLLKVLTGIETPQAGTVRVLGHDTAKTLPEEIAEDVVYVHQNPEEMFVADTVRGDVAYYLEQRGYEDADERVDRVLRSLDLTHLEDRDGRLLSVGQQRRASLAIGLAMEPSLVLLDEPTGCLDVASRGDVTETIDRVGDRVQTVLVATHDLQLAASWATRVVVMSADEVLADGPPGRVFEDETLLETSNLRLPQVVELSARLGVRPFALDVDDLAARIAAEGR
ncbi:ABC transporter ATP-binding protein [Halegenticoccus tardaugens]|uniref:ABC transporter ATP-binding protein n=1 Tax=Halegenticoccus tardaugens TaxID=2071624 RepID=UPI00100AA65B|nr:ABC transporter ATP-binding protein [Halegenticoccus tardaugens]